MGEFGLTVSLEGVVIGLLGESERIEESNRVKSSDDGVDVRDGLGGRGRLGSSERREGSGRSGRGDEGGGNELHFDCLDVSVLNLLKFGFMTQKRMKTRKQFLSNSCVVFRIIPSFAAISCTLLNFRLTWKTCDGW